MQEPDLVQLDQARIEMKQKTLVRDPFSPQTEDDRAMTLIALGLGHVIEDGERAAAIERNASRAARAGEERQSEL